MHTTAKQSNRIMRLRSNGAESRAVPFPAAAAASLHRLASGKEAPLPIVNRAANTLRSFRDAPAQRQQSAALKLLGGILREKHPEAASSCSLCSFAAPALAALILDNVVSSYTVSCAALRAVIRTRCPEGSAGPPLLFLSHFDALFQRLEAMSSMASSPPDDGEAGLSVCDLDRRVRDVRAVVAIVGEPECRMWIYGFPERLLGSAALGMSILRNAFDDALDISPESFATLDAVIISGLQLLQDVCRAACDVVVGRLEGRGCDSIDQFTFETSTAKQLLLLVRDIPPICMRVCESSNLQRRNLMASAVLVVSSNCCDAILSSGVGLALDEALAVVEEKIIAPSRSHSSLMQLFLLRAVIESPDLIVARGHLIPVLLERFCQLCSGNSDLALRYMSMESIVLSLRQLPRGSLEPTMRARILELVQERWEENYSGISSQMRDTVDALVALDSVDDRMSESAFWLNYALGLLDNHTSSVGMYSPMSRLIGRVGAKDILKNRPNAQAVVLSAVVSESTAAKPASEWLEAFWRSLLREEDLAGGGLGDGNEGLAAFTSQTTRAIVAMLVDNVSPSQRERLSMYVVPAYMRACEDREESVACSAISAARDMSLGNEDIIRVTVVMLSACQRACGARPEVLSNASVSSQLRAALENDDPEIRLGALELVASARTPTNPVEQTEADLLLESLPVLLYPGYGRAEVSRVQRQLCKFLTRICTSRNAAETCGGWWSKERKKLYGGKRPPEFEESRVAYVRFANRVITEFVRRLLAFSHPCAAPERRRIAVELLSELISVAGVECLALENAVVPKAAIFASTMRLVADEWEPCRSAALVVASSVPAASSGMDKVDVARSLLELALKFVRSPRLSEAEPGAAICRLVFRKAVPARSPSQGPILFDAPVASRGEAAKGHEGVVSKECTALYSHHIAVLRFFDSVLEALGRTAAIARDDLPAACMTGLFFGDVRVLRVCILDADWAALCADPSIGVATVRNLARRIIKCLDWCVRESLKGLDLETNSVFYDTGDVSGDILLADEFQKVATSCYLSAKEVSMAVGVVVQRMGTISGCWSRLSEGERVKCSPSVQDSVDVLEVGDMEVVGALFTLILSTVRHNGVLNGASDGYEHVCSYLLQSTRASFRALPLRWARAALDAAMKGEMYTLRRSAGVPYFALGAIRAEGRIAQRGQSGGTPILCEVVDGLLAKLCTVGFSNANGAAVASSPIPLFFEGAEEEAVVHCLNVLRFIIADSAVARPMTRFLARCVMISIQGFNTTSWLVRNSAFILFGALVRRSLGVGVGDRRDLHSMLLSETATACQRTTTGSDTMRILGVTPSQFFSRYQELHPFLLDVLRGTLKGDGAKSNQRALFPTIHLLSCLSPTAESDQEDSLSMSHFSSVVDRCLGARAEPVRRAAATACVPILSDASDVATQIEDAFVSRLPRSFVLGQNRLHGELLRLGALLKGWCYGTLMPMQSKRTVVASIAKHLPDVCWIAVDRDRNKCPVTRAAMLRVIRRIAKLASFVASAESKQDSSCGKGRCKHLLDVCMNVALSCLEFEAGVGAFSVREVIGMPATLRGATKLAFIVLNAQVEQGYRVSSDVHTCPLFDVVLHHSSADVRDVALKCCTESVVLTRLAAWPMRLWESMVDIVCYELNPRVLEGALRLSSILLSQVDALGGGLVCCVGVETETGEKNIIREVFLARIVELSCESSFLDVREEALVVLGYCVREVRTISGHGDMFSQRGHELTCKWLSLVESASGALTVPSSRVSAARSLEQSAVLYRGHFEESRVRARTQLIVLRLLQDENSSVRVCSKRLVRQLSGRASEGTLGPLPGFIALHDVMDLQNETAVLTYIENILGLGPSEICTCGVLHTLFGVQRSQCTQWRKGGAPEEFHGQTDAVAGGAAEKLFRDDLENMNDEPEVFVQLAARKLYKVSQGMSVSPELQELLHEHVQTWASELMAVLLSFEASTGFLHVFREHAANSFSKIHQLLCRIYAIQCFVRLPLSEVAEKIEAALKNSENVSRNLHPALYASAASLVSLLHSRSSIELESRSASRLILFLVS